MITMTNDMHAKIDLLDKLFGAMSSEQLKEFTESEQVVSRLRGDEANPGILRNLVSDNQMRAMEIQSLKSEIWQLKEDLKTLLKAVNQLYSPPVHAPSYSYEMQNLKSKYSVY